MNVLEIKGLNKEYKGFSLKNINLRLPAGYIMGYVGQNGAGKTTTINLINHICKFKEGEIRVNGITYEENQVKYKESIAYVGDESYFPKGYKVRDVRKTLKSFYTTFDEKKFGFEAIILSDDASSFGQNFTFEKPEISQIMLHSIKNRRENESI